MNTPNTSISVQSALQQFYTTNMFEADGGATSNYAWIKFGFISVPIPNTESRKQNILLHDLGHIVTGNDTSWKGESAVSAWEIASGGWQGNIFLWLLTLWAMGVGVLFYPTNTYNAFVGGLTMRNGLTSFIPRETLLNTSVEELRTMLSNHSSTKKNPLVWMALALGTILSSFVPGLVIVYCVFFY